MPNGADVKKTQKEHDYVMSILDESDDVDTYISYIGRGMPRVYYNENPPFPSGSVAQVLVSINGNDENMKAIIANFRRSFIEKSTSGVRVNVRQFEQGPPTGEPVQIRVTGENLQELHKIANEVESELADMDNLIQEMTSVGILQDNWSVEVDYDSALVHGVMPVDIALTNRLVLKGLDVGEFKLEYKTWEAVPVVLESKLGSTLTKADFEKLRIPTITENGPVTLDQVASISTDSSSPHLTRYNGDKTVFITAFIDDESKLSKVHNAIHASLTNLKDEWPTENHWTLTGIEEERGDAFESMYKSFFLSVSMIFVLTFMLFNSIWKPLIVMTGVYMSIGGSMLGLFLTNQPLGFMSLLGIIGLSGIVVRNGMMLVEFTDLHIKEGLSLNEALLKAGGQRLRPIVITSLTTIGGMIPMAFIGGSLWTPLAITIISGLLFSTFLTIFIVPSLYYWFANK